MRRRRKNGGGWIEWLGGALFIWVLLFLVAMLVPNFFIATGQTAKDVRQHITKGDFGSAVDEVAPSLEHKVTVVRSDGIFNAADACKKKCNPDNALDYEWNRINDSAVRCTCNTY